MNFIESIRSCFLDFAVFKGRSRRSEFWWFQLFCILGAIITHFLDIIIFDVSDEAVLTPIATTFDFAMLIPATAVTARRLHDVGKSGWLQLPNFLFYLLYLEGTVSESIMNWLYVPMGFAGVYFLWLLYQLIKDSDPGMNHYGHNPKEPNMGTVFD